MPDQFCMACGVDPIKGRAVQLNPPDPRAALCRACGQPPSDTHVNADQFGSNAQVQP